MRISEASVGSGFLILGQGNTSSLPSSIDLTGSIDFNRFYLLSSPVLSQDISVRSVSVLKDINNDGFNDLIIGDPLQSKAYVLFGKAIGLVGMSQGFTIYGEKVEDYLGWSVSSLGDVNGDGFNDLVTCGTVVSKCYVIYGRSSSFSDIYLANSLNVKKGFTITSSYNAPGGMAVSDGGDFNGDGVDDVVVSVTGSSLVINLVFVVFGKVSSTMHNIELTQLVNGVDGVRIVTPAWSFAGLSLSGGFDYNHDGYDDIIIGSTPFGTEHTTQTSYVVYGKPSRQLNKGFSLSSLTSTQGFSIKGAGFIVDGEVGDVNGDGLNDIVVVNNAGWDGQRGVYRLLYSDLVSSAPSMYPSSSPSVSVALEAHPTVSPNYMSTVTPSAAPSNPTALPTTAPSGPTVSPTREPTTPTATPTKTPSVVPTFTATARPSRAPTAKPTFSVASSALPTRAATARPTMNPSVKPSRSPTLRPTINLNPSSQVTSQPTVSAQNNFSTIFIDQGGNYSVTLVARQVQYIITAKTDTRITSHSIVSKYVVKMSAGVRTIITNFDSDTDMIDLTAFSEISSFDELSYRNSSFTLLLPNGQMIVLGNIQHKGELSAKNFLFSSASLLPSTSNDDGSGAPERWYMWKIILITVSGLFVVLCGIAYSYYRCSVLVSRKPTVLSKCRVFDVEAQNILKKTTTAAKSSAHRDRDYDKKDISVSVPQLVDKNRNDFSPVVSNFSSSFLSSISSVLKESDNEVEGQSSKQSKKKRCKEDFSPSPSMNIEEGSNEELSDSIIELESLNLSKEVDKLLLINESFDDFVSESDDSLYSIFSEESHPNF